LPLVCCSVGLLVKGRDASDREARDVAVFSRFGIALPLEIEVSEMIGSPSLAIGSTGGGLDVIDADLLACSPD